VKRKPSSAGYRIEPLGEQHDRAVFSCGVAALDQYLQRQAGQDVRKKVAAVFVLTGDGRKVAGFYSLSAHVVHLADVPAEVGKKLPRYPDVPATLLGRLAVDQEHRGQGLGEFLLLDALHRALLATERVASAAVVVDAKDDAARQFYCRYGFLPFPSQPNRLLYPMKAIEKLLGHP